MKLFLYKQNLLFIKETDTFGHISVCTIYTSHIDHFTPQHTAFDSGYVVVDLLFIVTSIVGVCYLVIVLCFVVRYFMPILVLLCISNESWLLCLVCPLGVS